MTPLFGLYLAGCGLLVAAGTAKVSRPHDTARALRDLISPPAAPGGLRSLRRWSLLVRVVAAGEGALGVVALVVPRSFPAALVTFSYLAFSAFVLTARVTGGALATCGCFGAPDTPPSVVHAVIDLALAVAALGVVLSPSGGSVVEVLWAGYGHGFALLAAAAVVAVLAFAVMSPLARLTALRKMAPVEGGLR